MTQFNYTQKQPIRPHPGIVYTQRSTEYARIIRTAK